MKKTIRILLALVVAAVMLFALAACDNTCADGEHYFVEEVQQAATCTEKGTKLLRCTKCDYTEEQEIPATGHSYVYTPVSGEQKHTVRCANCDLAETTEACTLAGNVCSKCKANYTPQGGDDTTHKCTSVCPTCGKCTNATCTETACLDKCLGHSQGGGGGTSTVNVTIHFHTTEGWDTTNLHLYAWIDQGETLNEWPGITGFTAESGQQGWYVITLQSKLEGLRVIVNDGGGEGGKQTDNVIVSAQEVYIAGNTKKGPDVEVESYATREAALAAETTGGQGGEGGGTGGTSAYLLVGEGGAGSDLKGWGKPIDLTEEPVEDSDVIKYYVKVNLKTGDKFKVKSKDESKYFGFTSINWDSANKLCAKDDLFETDENDNIVVKKDCVVYLNIYTDSVQMTIYTESVEGKPNPTTGGEGGGTGGQGGGQTGSTSDYVLVGKGVEGSDLIDWETPIAFSREVNANGVIHDYLKVTFKAGDEFKVRHKDGYDTKTFDYYSVNWDGGNKLGGQDQFIECGDNNNIKIKQDCVVYLNLYSDSQQMTIYVESVGAAQAPTNVVALQVAVVPVISKYGLAA